MSGECDECGEDALSCRCNEKKEELQCDRCDKPAQKRYICVGTYCDKCWNDRYDRLD